MYGNGSVLKPDLCDIWLWCRYRQAGEVFFSKIPPGLDHKLRWRSSALLCSGFTFTWAWERRNACVCVCWCSNDVTLGPDWVVLKAVHGISLSNYLFCISTDGGWPWPTSEVIWSLFRQKPIKTHLPGSPQSDWDTELLHNCEETGSDFQSRPIWLQPSALFTAAQFWSEGVI